MRERKEGWYHAQIDPGVWECGYWSGLRWEIAGMSYGDQHIETIGPRIPSPDEAPPIGTRYRNDAGEVVAIVVPAMPNDEIKCHFDKFHALRYHPNSDYRCKHAWTAMLAALPEPD